MSTVRQRKMAKKEKIANLNLVLEVQKYPCLYNHTLKEYSRRDVVDAAWEKISRVCGDTVENCKDKWRNFRTVFVRHLKLQADKTNRKAPYYLSTVMQFLIPYIKVPTVDHALFNMLPPGIEDEDHNTSDKTEEFLVFDEDENDSVDVDSSINQFESSNKSIYLSSELHDPSKDNFGINSITSLVENTPQKEESGKTHVVNDLPEDSKAYHKLKRKAHSDIGSFLEYLQEKRKKQCEPESHRKLFLLSLLPEVESMTSSQFRLFRRNVLDAVDKALAVPFRDFSSQTLKCDEDI